jgi:hypothetical protein
MTTTPTHPVTQASDEVEMQIRGLMMDPVTNMPIIVLKDIGSDLVLPIWVGIFEANAIALELEKTAMPRPMTHDLLQNMARGLNAEVRKVVVSELRDDTFYAVIWMDHAGETVTMDARTIGCDCACRALGLPDLCQSRGAGEFEAGGQRAACECG